MLCRLRLYLGDYRYTNTFNQCCEAEIIYFRLRLHFFLYFGSGSNPSSSHHKKYVSLEVEISFSSSKHPPHLLK